MRFKRFLFILASLVGLTFAHPHVFVDASVQVLFGEKGFSGIKNKWVYDEIYSTAVIASVDKNGDGKLTQDEGEQLKPVVFSEAAQMNYFNYVQSGSEFLKVDAIKNFRASVQNRRLVIEFVAKFFVPVSGDYSMLVIVVADPTNYVQVTTDMEEADVSAPESIDVEYFADGLEGLSLFRAFLSDIEGLYLRFKNK